MQCALYHYDITMQEGGTYDKWFKWSAGGVVVSLAGITAHMQIRKKIKDTDVLLNVPFVSTPWIADGTTGIYLMDVGTDDRYRIYIKDNDSLGLCSEHKNIIGVYDLFLYNSDEESILKQYGSITITAAVTR